MTLTKPLLEAIENKFTVGDGCWEWTGSRSGGGYGRLMRQGVIHYALVASLLA